MHEYLHVSSLQAKGTQLQVMKLFNAAQSKKGLSTFPWHPTTVCQVAFEGLCALCHLDLVCLAGRHVLVRITNNVMHVDQCFH